MVVLISVVIHRMLGGWRNRAQRQDSLVGTLPTMPDELGPPSSRGPGPLCRQHPGARLALSASLWATSAIGARRCSPAIRRDSARAFRGGAHLDPQDSITGVHRTGFGRKVLPGDRSKGVKAGTGAESW